MEIFSLSSTNSALFETNSASEINIEFDFKHEKTYLPSSWLFDVIFSASVSAETYQINYSKDKKKEKYLIQ